jgi:hypothetical protein
MLRRRRPLKNESIHFSFDSFLDLVTNVVGIIIRLILVTWVGASSYHAVQPLETEPASPAEQIKPLPPAKITDEPLYSKLEIARLEIEEAKARLAAQINEIEVVEQKTTQTQAQVLILTDRGVKLASEGKTLVALHSEQDAKVRQVSLSLEEIRQRTKKLLQDIKALEAQPLKKKQLTYHAPLSRPVHGDQIYFECQNGRVSFIDLPSFILEIKQSEESIAQELKSTWRLERTTAPVGPYRLRYRFERERSMLDAGATPSSSSFRYGLSGWVVEPVTQQRGETLEKALSAKSEFRQVADVLDANLSVVTFWVYPDSFELFRHLRDYLYERGIDVAARPQLSGHPIAASRYGTASRGQ